ncbi:MAG: hypothetical protein O7C63_09020 [Alphaproteobacteria bacterium]|nr:hypothetical protein [Alphaproteobacteria bacterium]
MPMKRARLPWLAIWVLAGLVAACSPPRIPGLPGSERAVPPPCPPVILIDDTEELTKFLPGPGRDLIDVVLQAEITGFSGECETTRERDGSGLVEMTLNVVFAVTRGPATRDDVGEFTYFVAIIDGRDRIMRKAMFPVAVRFGGNNTIRPNDTVFQEFELAPGEPGDAYTVIVGFQLTDDQLRQNRGRGG